MTNVEVTLKRPYLDHRSGYDRQVDIFIGATFRITEGGNLCIFTGRAKEASVIYMSDAWSKVEKKENV